MISLYQKHVQRWTGCTDCLLSECRGKMVFARGTVPCDVLFIGEAPGESENVIGKPFVGPAGKLLDAIIESAFPKRWVDDATDPQGAMAEVVNGAPAKFSHALTNLTCCIPRQWDGSKAGEPEPQEIVACQPRLAEFVGLCRPKMIVCVGKLAALWVPRLPPMVMAGIKVIDVAHPAHILRANAAQRPLMVQRVVVTLANALEELS